MESVKYGYKLKRSTVRHCWLFYVGKIPMYELHRGPASGTWYVSPMLPVGKAVACAGTLRDAVIKACQLEELI
jgi:hypothetical protein